MKRINNLLLFCCLLFGAVHLNAQCTTAADGPFINLEGVMPGAFAPCGANCGTVFTLSAFEVFASESYIFYGVVQGNSYTVDICTGAGANTWAQELVVGPFDGPNSTVSVVDGSITNNCSLTFTASASGDYLIMINEVGSCGILNPTDGGNLSVQCNGTAACPPIPAEDICTGAAVITVDSGSACTGTTDINRIGATDSDSDPNTPAATCTSYAGGDVWWTFTSISGSQPTIISGAVSAASFFWYEAYSGPDCANLTSFACSNTTGNDPSTFELDLGIIPAGDQIWIRGWDSNNDNAPGVMSLCAFLGPCVTPEATATIDCNGDIMVTITNEGEAAVGTSGGYTWDIDGVAVTMPTGGGTFTGFATTQSHSISATGSTNNGCDGLVAIAAPLGCELVTGCTDAMNDGGFESGPSGGVWTEVVADANTTYTTVAAISTALPYTGLNGADLGGFATVPGIALPISSSVSQTVAIPADATMLSFWGIMFGCGDGLFTFSIDGASQVLTGTGPIVGGEATCGDGIFYRYDLDISSFAGSSVLFEFSMVESTNTADTRMFIDNIILQNCPATACNPTETITGTSPTSVEATTSIVVNGTTTLAGATTYDAPCVEINGEFDSGANELDVLQVGCTPLNGEPSSSVKGEGNSLRRVAKTAIIFSQKLKRSAISKENIMTKVIKEKSESNK